MNTKPENAIVIQPHDLPLHCSGPDNNTWDGHPRVFLPIHSYGTAECPYCGTVYYLDGEAKGH